MDVNILFALLFFGFGFAVGAFITLAWFVPHTSPAELHTLVQLDAFNASIKADEMRARKIRLMEAQIKFFDRWANRLPETRKGGSQ